MARHLRRLTLWFLAGIAALAILALLALAALWWWFDPDDYRAQIEARASSAIGRPVHLTGALRWQLGRQITLVSEGGDIANVAGFGNEPLARWLRIRLGVATRPLLNKRVEIDRIDVDGLQLNLQRDAAGAVNWALQPPTDDEQTRQPVSLRIGTVAVHDGALRYQDAGTGADWRVANLQASTKLPPDLATAEREFRDVNMEGRLSGGRLAAEGVQVSLQTPLLQVSPQRVQVAEFTARWADAKLAGGGVVQLDALEGSAELSLQAPSLRMLLATANVTPPPMRDPTTPGKFELGVTVRYAANAATFDEVSLKLDDTSMQGKLSLPSLTPLAIRFSLNADRVDLDRYREPADVKAKPLELPLAWLKQLDAQGTLRIRQATVAGAAAKEVRIDVE